VQTRLSFVCALFSATGRCGFRSLDHSMKMRTLFFLVGWFVLMVPELPGQSLAQPQPPARNRENSSVEMTQGFNEAVSIPREPGPAWRLESDENGISVYSRKMEGSSIREVLTETTISAPLKRVLKAIEDYRNYPEFMPYVKESIVSEEEMRNMVFYCRFVVKAVRAH
jgi:hypothetical protein